jgi:hypothetical protein
MLKRYTGILAALILAAAGTIGMLATPAPALADNHARPHHDQGLHVHRGPNPYGANGYWNNGAWHNRPATNRGNHNGWYNTHPKHKKHYDPARGQR